MSNFEGHSLNRFQTEMQNADRRGCTKILVAVAVVSCAFVAVRVAADDAVAPLSVPIRILPSSQNDDSQPEMQNQTPMPRPRPQPTTPGGKLPQYQLGHHHRRIPTEAELNDPTLRLILALPDMPILIDATITIDGEPYLMARERRIHKILEEAAKPVPSVVQATVNADETTNVNGDGPRKEAEAAAAIAQDDEPTPPGSNSDDREENEEGGIKEGESDSASEDTPKESDESEPEAEPVTPPTVPEYSLPSTVSERLRRFVAATGEAATMDEVRWMLTNWVDGPVLLFLDDNFQRFRANQRPVFNVLDSDRDGIITGGELANAVTAFEKCDFNRNDIVEYTELAIVATDPEFRLAEHSGPGKLIFRVPDEKSAVAMYRRIAARYPPTERGAQRVLPRFDVNANGRLDTEELAVLRAAKPDLSFTMTFNSDDPAASRIEVTGAGTTLSAASVSEAIGSISVPIGGTTVVFSAVQSDTSDQISIGAVNDGYPILPVIDPNEDGRFTIRERRGLLESLLKFDKNLDGSLSRDETQATIRVCFGLGPLVHQELIALRQVNPKSKTPVVTGPDWFVRMDRNRDNDVSPNEFPGQKSHFAELDTDRDALVSAQEALDYDQRQSQPASNTEATAEEPTDSLTRETATETE